MHIPNLSNKTILLTQNSLRFIAGSEIVLLELAEFFQNIGAKVIVFTWFLDNPMKAEFKKRHIEVTTDDFNPKFNNLDYVWIQHQVVPIGLLENLLKPTFSPYFIFNHMSALNDLYLEQPYVCNLEKTLASINTFVSKESLNFNLSKYPQTFRKPLLFPNPSPEKFFQKTPPSQYIKKILVVSNHPPKELKSACQKLTEETIEVDYLGKVMESYQIVTPSILQKYDAIVTIGKTVQYCLALNKPVYIYDHFGGCGYLNSKNFKTAQEHNFSGRGFKKKSSNKIAEEIITKFYSAQKFQAENHDKFIEYFSLQNNIANIFSHLPKQPPKIVITKEQLNHLTAAETIAKEKIIAENQAVNIPQLNHTIILQQNRIAELEQTIADLNSTIQLMQNSRTVKLINKAHSLPKLVKTKILNHPNQQIKSTNLFTKDYTINYLKKPSTSTKYQIIGLILEYNESLILNDTLTELEKIVDGFIILDDCSNDQSANIAKNHPKCLAIIKHLTHKGGDRSMEESVHREMLLQIAKKYSPKWLFYQDADERIDSPQKFRQYMLNHINDKNLSGIRISLFDAYMTTYDHQPYQSGQLLNFRKYFGPERRDILFAWKNTPRATFITAPVMREPDNIDQSKVITKFYVQHYGKALSTNQWEETCDYYIKHFPQYAKKWQSRKGKSIHKSLSDFNRPLDTWENIKKSGGIKIN